MTGTRIVRAIAASLLLIGCDASTEPLPLQVSLTVSPQSPVAGDTVTFVVAAQGGALLGVLVDFGDDVLEQFHTAGARTARVTLIHVYDESGTYVAVATLADASAGTVTDSAIVVVR